jgi:hypothetical protein
VSDGAPPEVLTLEPDRRQAAGWFGLALVLLAMTGWLAHRTGGAAWAWVGVAVAVALAGYFLVPLTVPRLTTVVLDGTGLRGRAYHVELDVVWEAVRWAQVVAVAGEPILELHVREPSPVGDPWRTRAVGLLLPLGCDVAALHGFLAARLGTR